MPEFRPDHCKFVHQDAETDLLQRNPRLLHFAVGEEPDEGFVVDVDDLDAVAPGVAKVAAEGGWGRQAELILRFRSG